MFMKIIAVTGLSLGIATAALAQSTSPGGLDSGASKAPEIAPDLSIGQHGAIGTDPGITNSTIDNNGSGNGGSGAGGVDLYKGGNTINPGGVNPALQSSPTCGANPSDATAAGGDGFCP